MKLALVRWSKVLIVAVVCVLALTIFWEVNVAQDKKVGAVNNDERMAVETAIHNVMAWAINKDFDLFFGTIADDSNFVSVTPYDKVKFGVGDVIKDTAFWASPDFKAVRHDVSDLRITFSRSGDVAWYYCVLNDINEWKGQPANWENVRWTGVVEKRDGKWRVVQQHFSWPLQR